MLTKGAIGNLINRYKAVLTKCNLINTFGSLAVASMLVLGGAGVAEATDVEGLIYTNAITIDNYTNTNYIKKDIGSLDDKILTINCHSSNPKTSNHAIWVGGGDEKFVLNITDSSKEGVININGIVQAQSGNHYINAKNININSKNSGAIFMAGGSLELNAETITISSKDAGSNTIQEGDSSKLSITANTVSISSARTALRATRGMEVFVKANTLTISTTNSERSAIESDDVNDSITLDVMEATLNGNVLSAGVFNANGQFNLNGQNNTFNEIANSKEGGNIEFVLSNTDTTVNVTQNKADNIGVTGSAELTNEHRGDINALAEQVKIEKGGEGTTLKLNESGIYGETTAKLGADNKVDQDTIKQKKNRIMDAALQQASITTVSLDRILTNDVRKRLGDIRSDKNQTGVWMRWDGGKLKGNSGLTNNFNTIQIGGDTKAAKNCRIGFAGSFTHGDMDFSRGNGELEGFSFALYGTWMGENGMFADVVARLGKFSTEMNVDGMKGDMDNRVASLSGEYGWRFNVCDQFFVEPQVELAYTYVSSDDLQLSDNHYEFDNVDSLTGRAGVVAGWQLPEERGNVYARASVVQQFMGDAKISGTNGTAHNVQEIDGEDTWLEYGIGANVKLTDSTYVWADVERTEGADIEEEWRGTVGVRFSF